MKKLKFTIIVVLISIIMLVGTIIIIKKVNNNYDKVNTIRTNDINIDNLLIEEVKDSQQFYNIRSIILSYISNVNSENSQDVLKQLAPDYIKEFNINKDNVISKENSIINEKSYEDENIISIDIEKMYSIDMYNNITCYLVKGKTIDNIEKKENDFKIVIYTDRNNKTYYIFPSRYIDKHQLSENQADVKKYDTKIQEISNSGVNVYTDIKVNDSKVILDYIAKYKREVIYNIEDSYNLIDETYRNLKFGNLEVYKQYVEEHMLSIQNMSVSQYKKIEEDDDTRYILRYQNNDQYFMIKEKSIMNFKIYLDTYTVDTPEFIKKYNEATDQVKQGMNIEKFLNSLNDKDYKYAYKVLDKTFKQNNFPTQDEFEKYIKKNLFDYNFIKYNNYTTNNGLGVYYVTISNTDNSEDDILTRNLTIIMKLKEGTDFVMSFGIE